MQVISPHAAQECDSPHQFIYYLLVLFIRSRRPGGIDWSNSGKIGNLSAMTYLAVPIQTQTYDQAVKAMEQAISRGAELLELRLDNMTEPSVELVRRLVTAARRLNRPIIATCRPMWEGGNFAGSEKERKLLLEEAVKVGADYIDVELAGLNDLDCEKLNAKLIISSHDFKSMPADLLNLLDEINLYQPAAAKIAYTARRITDSFAGLDILHTEASAGRVALVLAMGPAGIITRLLAKKLGGFLTFAALEESAETAAGQITIEEMKRLYRWDAINSETKVYGVIGCPVGHSMSPAIHNAAFDETGYNGLYLPFLVGASREEFYRFIDEIRRRNWLDIKGLSITIPHKLNALNYIEDHNGRLEELAHKIGAVNTLLFEEDGQISGFNTDYAGALETITQATGMQVSDMKGLNASIIGAGGVARALAAGLTDAGAEVTIYNRTIEKAKTLAEEFGCKWYSINDLKNISSRLVINCSSIGMHPQEEATPIPKEYLRQEMVVFDTVYNPMETMLLRDAREVGAKTIDGVSMFVNQAAIQFEMFTGAQPPVKRMAEVVRAALSKI